MGRMYSILLVDDEIYSRQIIRTSIDWEGSGFTVIGEAENGLEALELIQEKNPDVVITDIKMPYMDGIGLIQELRKTHPTTTVIILSGYDEFTFAQKAIQLDVAHYALKPLCKDDFVELLAKIKTHLDDKIEGITHRKMLETAYRDAVSSLRQQVLEEVFAGHPEKALAKSETYDLPLGQDFYLTAIAELPGTEFGLETANRVIENCLEEIPSAFTAMIGGYNVITFYRTVKKDRSVEESLFVKESLNRINEIRKYLTFYAKAECSVGVSRPVYGFADLAESRRQAITALNYRPYFPHCGVFYLGDLESEKLTAASTQTTDDGIERLLSEVKLGDHETIDEAVNRIFCGNAKIDPAQTQAELFKTITALASLAFGYDIDVTRIGEAWPPVASALSSVGTAQSVAEILRGLCRSLHGEIEARRKTSGKKFVEEAKRQIEINYGDPRFSLDSICGTLGVSESYFSSTFKKECGVAFVKALTATRIDHAKALLENLSLKTYEIAEQVGFTDANYFSFSFKKTTGLSPQAYRKSLGPQ